jgi:acyl-CoA synthetase (AMP-forming)/AMP-acid ligase II
VYHLNDSKDETAFYPTSSKPSKVTKPTYEELEARIQKLENELQQRVQAEKDLH